MPITSVMPIALVLSTATLTSDLDDVRCVHRVYTATIINMHKFLVCVCVHACACVCVHACACACTCACVHVHVCMCVHAPETNWHGVCEHAWCTYCMHNIQFRQHHLNRDIDSDHCWGVQEKTRSKGVHPGNSEGHFLSVLHSHPPWAHCGAEQ